MNSYKSECMNPNEEQQTANGQGGDVDFELSPEELKQMLADKTLEVAELTQQLAAKEREVTSALNRAMRVHQDNELLKASDDIAAAKARMDYQMQMADRLVKAGALKVASAEEAFVLIQAGSEMGLKPMESLNGLYIVNGSVKPYGKLLSGIMTREGYRIEYQNEDSTGVTIRVYHPGNGFDATETVSIDSPTLKNSKAMRFAPENKMRYHCLRKFSDFHLAHLFGGLATEYDPKTIEIGHEDVTDQADDKLRDFASSLLDKVPTRHEAHARDFVKLNWTELAPILENHLDDSDFNADKFVTALEQLGYAG